MSEKSPYLVSVMMKNTRIEFLSHMTLKKKKKKSRFSCLLRNIQIKNIQCNDFAVPIIVIIIMELIKLYDNDYTIIAIPGAIYNNSNNTV